VLGQPASVYGVRCPICAALDDKVVDSRATEDGTAIRRRRECLTCGRRFTTFERLEEVPLMVVKRSGDRVAFDRDKVEAGIRAAAKGRPVSGEQLAVLVTEIEDELRLLGPEVKSEQIGVVVLERLRDLDKVAYLRFASVYKDFDDPSDFQREVRLLTKATAPKRH
jgi:transcriptional repressor NrdR